VERIWLEVGKWAQVPVWELSYSFPHFIPQFSFCSPTKYFIL